MLPRAFAAPHSTEPLDDTALVRPSPTANPKEVAKRLMRVMLWEVGTIALAATLGTLVAQPSSYR